MDTTKNSKTPQPMAFRCEYLLDALPESCPCDPTIIVEEVLPDLGVSMLATYTMNAVINGLDQMQQDEATLTVNAHCDGPKRTLLTRRPKKCGLETVVQIKTSFSNPNLS